MSIGNSANTKGGHGPPYGNLGSTIIPSATFERATSSFLLHAAPLLEEKWDFDSQALIPNIRDPFLHDRRSCAGTKLAADDHPIEIRNVAGIACHLLSVV